MEACEGAWTVRDLKTRCMGARGARDQRNRNFERCLQSPMASRLPRVCKSAQDDLSGTFTNVIGAIFAAVMQRVVVCVV